jgi:glycosyltransferase involved in cell wall biosynthesis
MISDSFNDGFSILIPTWNNLKYLSACVDSIKKYSHFDHEIILHINDGSDGTIDYAKRNNLKFSYSKENAGVCVAMNQAYKLASRDIIFYFNDDMFALPDWDLELYNFCKDNQISKNALISSIMIEGFGDNICCLAPYNYGLNIESFELDRILRDLPHLKTIKGNVKGSTWPPNGVHRDVWEEIGGYSEEFSPGMGSDPDFVKKMFDAGSKDFIGVGSSLVYHFGSKTTKGRSGFRKNDGDGQFLRKYGISVSHFVFGILGRGTAWNKENNQ